MAKSTPTTGKAAVAFFLVPSWLRGHTTPHEAARHDDAGESREVHPIIQPGRSAGERCSSSSHLGGGPPLRFANQAARSAIVSTANGIGGKRRSTRRNANDVSNSQADECSSDRQLGKCAVPVKNMNTTETPTCKRR